MKECVRRDHDFPGAMRGECLPGAPGNFLGNEFKEANVYKGNKAAGLRAATLSPTNHPRTETSLFFEAEPTLVRRRTS